MIRVLDFETSSRGKVPFRAGKAAMGIYLPQDLSCESAIELAHRLEKAGYDSIWLNDHLTTHPVPSDAAYHECWTLLTALAVRVPRIRFGPMVLSVSFRHPALLAKMVGTLNEISHGRLILGLGAGWYENEYSMYGFPFLDSRSRIAMLKETIEVLKGLWGNDKFSYSGKFYHLKEAYCSPKATTPIWVGTFKSGHLMLDLCARLADGINIWGSPPQLRESLEILNELCHKYDRDITKSWSGICIIGKSKEEVMKKVRAFLKPGQSLEDYAEPRLVGTQKEIEEKIKIYEEMGISHFILRFPYLEDAVEF